MKRWAPGIAAAAIVFAAGLWLVHGTRGMPLDDAYIHLAFARNLAQGHGFSFNPGEKSLGFSSPLWLLLTAANARLKLDPVAGARLLSIAFMAVSALLLYFVTLNSLVKLRTGIFPPPSDRAGPLAGETALAATAALGLAAAGHQLWLAGLGMEPSLFLCLGLASILLLVRERPRVLAGGTMLGLAALTRTEGLILIPLLPLLMARRIAALDSRERTRMTLKLLLPALLLPAAWAVYSYLAAGFFTPPTRAGKLAANLFNSGLSLKGVALYAFRHLVWLWKHEPGLIGLIFIALVGPIFARLMISRKPDPGNGQIDRARKLSWKLIETPAAALVAWTAIHFMVHALFFRSAWLITPYNNLRYHVMLAPALFCAAALSLWIMALNASPRSAARPLTVYALLAWLILAAPLALEARKAPLWKAYYQRNVEHLQKVHKAAALWVKENTPADARPACLDVGLLAFYSDRYVIDLGGLTDPAILPYLDAHRTGPYLLEKQATHHLELIRHHSEVITGVNKDRGRLYRLTLLEHFEHPFFAEPAFLHSFGILIHEVTYLRGLDGERRESRNRERGPEPD